MVVLLFRCSESEQESKLIISDSFVDSSTTVILQMNEWKPDTGRMSISIQKFLSLRGNTSTISTPISFFTDIGLLKIYQMNEEKNKNVYDIFLLWRQRIGNTQYYANNINRCYHIRELKSFIPFKNEQEQSLENLVNTFKMYHRPCQQLNISCFYDELAYFCTCDHSYKSASCALYDFKFEQCDYCKLFSNSCGDK